MLLTLAQSIRKASIRKKAVPRMQIVFTDENSDCFSAVTANNGFEYVADYNAPTDAEKTANRAEYEGYIEDLSTFPTSMSIGGKQIVGFPEDCVHQS